jgi:isoquinoline 1-oxidoreductase alpha subunit
MSTTNFTLNVNSKKYTVDVEPETPLLWVIREYIGLTGTKYGCGLAVCGACTVHLNGKPMRSCVLPVSGAVGSKITTIEGISEDGNHPMQEAWIKEQVPQCGYCQSGQIMQAISLLNKNSDPSREEIKSHMNGIICRCGTYNRIIKAVERVTEENK